MEEKPPLPQDAMEAIREMTRAVDGLRHHFDVLHQTIEGELRSMQLKLNRILAEVKSP